MTQTITDYPIFEADQVLSQSHLNQLVGYLEEQDRLSRVYLHGIGIVCGLEISKPNATTIYINCGTAITSLGFLIPFEENEYTRFKNTIISEDFLEADVSKHAYLENIYQWADKYAALNPCIELLPDDSEDVEGRPLTEEVMENKVVMLLLESPLIDEKNCVTIDCADKGKRLESNVRVLLVDEAQLEEMEILDSNCQHHYFEPLKLPRYNSPLSLLITGTQVLEKFLDLSVRNTSKIGEAIEKLHSHLRVHFSAEIQNYDHLSNATSRMQGVINAHKTNSRIQYIWDWISDLVGTYNEIVSYNSCDVFTCCPSIDLFPFHVLLGRAEGRSADNIENIENQRFRTSFTKTGYLSQDEETQSISVKGLLQKLIRQISSFHLYSSEVLEKGIKITPSIYGPHPLSAKSVPFYYQAIEEMNKDWSPSQTAKNLHSNNLSYHSATYSSKDHVNKPLEYDIEDYNFFRIEGHVGRRVTEAVKEIQSIVNRYQVPIKVIALNAVDYEGDGFIIEPSEAHFGDLELDYDLVRRDWENVIGLNIQWFDANQEKIKSFFPSNNEYSRFIRNLKNGRSSMHETLYAFYHIYPKFIGLYEDIEEHAFNIRKKTFDDVEENRTKNPVFAEDLIDHLDQIILVCQKGEFRQLYQTATAKLTEIGKKTTLRKFIENHPGLEHKAGVTVGGTFVLVYQNNRSQFFTAGTGESVEVATDSIERANPNTSGPRLAKPIKKKEECIKAYQKEFESYISTAYPAYIAKDIFNYNSNYNTVFLPPTVSNFRIQPNYVIADFFLPYICCGIGDNVNIVINQDKPEPIVADFDHRDFDDSDFHTNIDNN